MFYRFQEDLILLNDNEIEDISPLEDLYLLYSLELCNNHIQEIKAFENGLYFYVHYYTKGDTGWLTASAAFCHRMLAFLR